MVKKKLSTNNVLVLNVGSSSLKFTLFSGVKKILGGKCDKISQAGSHLEINGDVKGRVYASIPNYAKGLDMIMKYLKSQGLLFGKIAHRVVHGGPIKNTTKISKSVEETITKFSSFAPLHNPNQLKVISICKKYKVPQYAVFDTAFYSSLPEVAFDFPIPREIVRKHNLRKFGFHGISHKCAVSGLSGRTISCHLGNGSSITASVNGKAIDTSMGLTPLAGIVMATRCGDLDPGLVLFLKDEGYDLDKILNNESGFRAYSKFTDIREIVANLDKKNVAMAFDIFIYSIVKFVGSYCAVLGGLDNLVFTGGIGEHIALVRERVCERLEFLGVRVDKSKNKRNELVISAKSSKVCVYVKKADEELQIAKEVMRLS